MGNFMHIHSKKNKKGISDVNDKLPLENKNTEHVSTNNDIDTNITESNVRDKHDLISNIDTNTSLTVDCEVKDIIDINNNISLNITNCEVKDIDSTVIPISDDINCKEKVSNDYLELTLDSENIDSPTIKEIYLRRKSISTNVTVVLASSPPYIYLLPHEHTLFCERKQRVCTTVGKLQELEVLKIEGFNDVIPQPSVWIRISHMQYNSNDKNTITTNSNTTDFFFDPSNNQNNEQYYHIIEGTEKTLEYKLSREDVGYYIGYRYVINKNNHNNNANNTTTTTTTTTNQSIDETTYTYLVADQYGLVLPGPPRLLEFTISVGTSVSNNNSSSNSSVCILLSPSPMMVGTYAIAQTNYIGGFEGPSEYWWMRINSEGCRTQITEPKRIPICDTTNQAIVIPVIQLDNNNSNSNTYNNNNNVENDPRYYKLTKDDLGCYLKAKCRPIRTDGVQGEIFTSKSSQIIIEEVSS